MRLKFSLDFYLYFGPTEDLSINVFLLKIFMCVFTVTFIVNLDRLLSSYLSARLINLFRQSSSIHSLYTSDPPKRSFIFVTTYPSTSHRSLITQFRNLSIRVTPVALLKAPIINDNKQRTK